MHALFLVGLADKGLIEVTGYTPQGRLTYDWPGNARFHGLLGLKPEEKTFAYLFGKDEPRRRLQRPDIIVNCLADNDRLEQSLFVACDLARTCQESWPGLPVFNSPESVALATASNIYTQHKELPGLLLPKVMPVRPLTPDHALEFAVREHKLKFPFLIRPRDGQSPWLRIDSMSDRPKLDRFPWNGGHYYITQYVDYKSGDGLYRKMRLAAIGGEFLPCHLLTGEDWLVSEDRAGYMTQNAAARAAERDFLAGWKKIIPTEALDSLRKIAEKRKLDYLVFDFALLPDNRLLIFYLGPARDVFASFDEKTFPYLAPVRENLLAALNRAFREKLGK